MMVMLRTPRPAPRLPGVTVKVTRKTPALVARRAGSLDHFCVGSADALAALGELPEAEILPMKDGWYETDSGGGVAIWGRGQYWEIRASTLVVAEACGPGG